MVTAAAGVDILCHALESYTARWYADFDAKRPEQRVPYCGANPIADMWSERALGLLAGAFRRAVRDGDDGVAREEMALAATFAGLGFGNAGVHIPHANAYPIAGRVRTFRPEGYPLEEPIVPHGMAVSLTAPEAFRFTFDAAPGRHLTAARLLDPGAAGDGPDARHRDSQRTGRGGLRRGRRRRPGRGVAPAAAAARHRTEAGDPRGPRGRLPRVDGALVSSGHARPEGSRPEPA
jgi:alcohol dehydrogenase class IV